MQKKHFLNFKTFLDNKNDTLCVHCALLHNADKYLTTAEESEIEQNRHWYF